MKLKDILTYHGILETALRDGTISHEERRLLESIADNYKEYHRYLEKALEDGIVGDDETEKLRKIKIKMYKNVLKIAAESEGLSEDEMAIIESLKNALKLDPETSEKIEREVLG